MSADERAALRQEVHDVIRTTTIGRGAALASTPDEIVEMTVKAIAERLDRWVGQDPAFEHGWYPRASTLGVDICRRLDQTTLSPKALATAKKVVREVAS
ncbi:hypothetical protein [Pseudonocardia sediminis]|uniref:hypothetical protein n=1 Tax=Pseudonocardia sediminis TaxID=1397368 RepID=UPI00102996FE|nr:hypothetical protein [Pseudonocardia sediminis]